MSDTLEADVYNGFLPANFSHATTSTSNPRRSASAVPSERSSGSSTTLVEDSSDLAYAQNMKFDDDSKVLTYERRKHTFANRLRGIFSVKMSKKQRRQKSVQPRPESRSGSSPWILPVYVLSTRQDRDKHRVPMEAKCTIDTGNMQGNIVSRKFVEEVLEYPESAFCALTAEEEVGATSITGHQLIPQGAIYLTWYHKKSTRVFRDMRFLISPIEHFDLIIGARSIQKDRLLDVPNLMSGIGGKVDFSDDSEDPTVTDALDNARKIKAEILDLTMKIRKATRVGETEEAEQLQEKKNELQKELPIAEIRVEIAELNADGSKSKEAKAAERKVLSAKLKDTPGYVKSTPIRETGSSTRSPTATGSEKPGANEKRVRERK